MNNRSILFLTNAYPDFESSYRGIFIQKMARLLIQEGYEVSVVTPKIYKESPCLEERNGIKVYRFGFFSGNRLLIEYDRVPYLRMVLYYLSGFSWTIYVFLRRRCQLIHVHWAIPTGLIGILVGAILKRPVVVTIHGSDFRLGTGRSSLLKKIFRFVCMRANHINCVSNLMEKEIKRMGIKGEKISSFPMGVDETFLEAGKKRQGKLEGRPFIILSNRNLLPIYNVSLLIRTIPLVMEEEPQAKFLIAGEGSEKENLRKEAAELKIGASVQFLGRIPHDDMPRLLAEADIYVSTSLADGTSVSLLEAMGSGAFPIVTDIPPNREWISDGENGFLAPTGNESILAGKIVEAIRNKKLVAEANAKNRELMEQKAHWKTNIRKIANIYESTSMPS